MLLGAVSLLLVLLLSGAAVFLALGVTATTMLTMDGHALGGIAQALVDRLNSATLTAVPFFATAATFMQRGGMAAALVGAAQSWVGGFHGGLAFVAVMAAALFACVSGSSKATALALGTILLPAMAARGYPVRFNCGVVGASATLGILLLPSLALIIFGLVASLPIRSFSWRGWFRRCCKRRYSRHGSALRCAGCRLWQPSRRCRCRAGIRTTLLALPALAVPTVALGGIYSGIVTLSEASALAAATAIVICWSNGSARGRVVIEWIGDAIKSSTTILVVVGFAVLLGHWIALSGAPEHLVGLLREADVSPLKFLLMMNLIMFVLGMFLDVISRS